MKHGNKNTTLCAAEKKEEILVRSKLPGGKVLVVDDLPTNLLVARGLLDPYELIVDTAASGREAVEMVKDHDYYRVSFANVPESEWQTKFDTAYFERFTALVESLNTTDMAGMLV